MRDTLARELTARAGVVAATPVLARLADRLTGFLEPLLTGEPYLPDAKALLSRDGGVCPADGARLAFDPRRPHEHTCPRCGRTVEGERHHRAWIVRYHIWLSERAVHLALLGALRGDANLSARAALIVGRYADRYRTWPDRDNVLGPSRPFFSTYLESIWLTQLALATLLADVGGAAPGPGVPAVLEESARRIASFPEGLSNRQAWNATALIAAGACLGRDEFVARGVRGPTGLLSLLEYGVGAEGVWHEGENYHLFALRGLGLGAELLRRAGGPDLYADGPLRAMFAAPLATVLPDLTLPARGDAPYGVSIRQPRFAELWEWGRARGAAAALEPVLARLYDDGAPEAPDEGWRELAEQEQNGPPRRLHRDRLGWKALLWMLPEEPAPGAPVWTTGVTALPDQGVVVLRPSAERYVALECGRRSGGHQHPDLLHLTLWWREPLLMDFGTASYVSPSLHWYRAPEAHNVAAGPRDGQPGQRAHLTAADRAAGWMWASAVAPGLLGAGTTVRRTVVAGPQFVLDIVDVTVPDGREVELFLHPLRPGVVRLAPRPGEEVLDRIAPGPPGPDFADGPPLAYLVRRAAGPGRWVQAYDPDGVIREVTDEPAVRLADGRFSFRIDDGRLSVLEDRVEVAQLGGARPAPGIAASGTAVPAREPDVALPLLPVAPDLRAWPRAPVFLLSGRQYRRSEVRYDQLPDGFRVVLAVGVHGSTVAFWFGVTKDPVVVRPPDAPDPGLDNEPAEIHSDGMQCYVGRDDWAGWLVLPDLDAGTLRVRPVAGTGADAADVRGECCRTEDGYQAVVVCETGRPFAAGDRVRFTATVNEMRPGRERRQGQLALAGGGWVYLRGDRERPEAALLGEVV